MLTLYGHAPGAAEERGQGPRALRVRGSRLRTDCAAGALPLSRAGSVPGPAPAPAPARSQDGARGFPAPRRGPGRVRERGRGGRCGEARPLLPGRHSPRPGSAAGEAAGARRELSLIHI